MFVKIRLFEDAYRLLSQLRHEDKQVLSCCHIWMATHQPSSLLTENPLQTLFQIKNFTSKARALDPLRQYVNY